MMATNQKIRRLPGFHFEARTPMREDVLPRMDIALFVGFAASGPVGVPVVLESAKEFDAIFGKDLPLVWDKERGETIYAYLAPTARAFFRNGGKRCWIIRVARRQPTAQKPLNRVCSNFFPLSGLAGVRFGETEIDDITPAFARARAPGSWSDDLQIGTAELSTAVKFVNLIDNGEQKVLKLEVSANEQIKTGELLRLKFSADLSLLLTTDKIGNDDEINSPAQTVSAGKRFVKITAKHFVWLENLTNFASPNLAQKVSVRYWTKLNNINSENITQNFTAVRQADLRVKTSFDKNGAKLPLKINLKFNDLPNAEAPESGSLLITKFQGKCLCLQVETVNINDSEMLENVEVLCRAVFCRKDVITPDSTPEVERLAFEIWIKKDENSFTKLSDLAFNSSQERFWGNLPTDENLYRFSEDKEFPEIPAWTQSGEAARFPLAGSGRRGDFYFPLFPNAFPENYLGAARLQGTKLQRDGLEEFDADLFLDEKLKNTGLDTLLNEAEFIRYFSPRPRALWGIHSALAPESTTYAAGGLPTNPTYTNLSLEEATIISVPDASHRGWFQTKKTGAILSPPPLSPPPPRPEWWHFQDCRKPEIERISEPLWENFLDCRIEVIDKPTELHPKDAEISTGEFSLIWNYAETRASTLLSKTESPQFVLEESAASNFQFSQEIYRGNQKEFTVSGRAAGVYYFRVRAELKRDFSDWSIGLAIKIPAAENYAVNASDDYKPDVLLAVQRALLRICAARGDLFAVLTLPEHYGRDAAVNHVATLKTTKNLTAGNSGVESLSANEKKALSFGAMYHPWLLTREDGFESARNIPASGAVCGVMARRTARRGAWIAPANEPLQGVLGLARTFQRESFLDFQDNLINLVRQEPTGFLVLDSDTLSDDSDLRPINVRRLLSLLRRLALKHGAEYVFEPNDERFRRQVQRGFTSLLDVMFARGAFAGTTTATSYQVVVSETLNNFQSVEQGRFIVELRVAPSLPLKFVSVRLAQSGGQSVVTERI